MIGSSLVAFSSGTGPPVLGETRLEEPTQRDAAPPRPLAPVCKGLKEWTAASVLDAAATSYKLRPWLNIGLPSIVYNVHLRSEAPERVPKDDASNVCYLGIANGLASLTGGCRLGQPETTLDSQLVQIDAAYATYFSKFFSDDGKHRGGPRSAVVVTVPVLPADFSDAAPTLSKKGVLFVAELSHPAARVLGAYASARAAGNTDPLNEWAKSAENAAVVSNALTRLLCGAKCPDATHPLTRTHLKLALTALRQFPVVLIREHPTLNLALLHLHLGWSAGAMPKTAYAGGGRGKATTVSREDPHSAAAQKRGYAISRKETVDLGSKEYADASSVTAIEAGAEAFAPSLMTWEQAVMPVGGADSTTLAYLKAANALDEELYKIGLDRLNCDLRTSGL